MSKKRTDSSRPFRPRARILRTLGEELISSETVALIELVKNAYDADATNVLIRFTGPLEPGGGLIEVIDNGHGMDIETVRSAWMELATPSRRERTRSERKKRRVLGAKGIGRFACARLANELELMTRRHNANTEVYAYFDWTQFDDEDKYLDDVLILSEERDPEDICAEGTLKSLNSIGRAPKRRSTAHGTILRMKNLKRKWNDSLFKDLHRRFSRLMSPFAEKLDFSIRLELPDKFAQFSRDIGPSELLKYPHYTVKGSVNADGSCNLRFKIHATGKKWCVNGCFSKRPEGGVFLSRDPKEDTAPDQQGHTEQMSPECGKFKVELRVWDRDELANIVQRTGDTVRNVRKDLDEIAGISIYRDGFRVLPYGEPKNDWLRLDLRRVQNPTLRLSNNQIVGNITVTADGNPQLQDQSNREGLDENQALHDLRGILLLVLKEIEAKRFETRVRKKPRGDKRTPLHSLFDAIDLGPLLTHMSELHPDDKAGQRLVAETEKSLALQVGRVQEVLARYHRLAMLGQLIDVVLHDAGQPLGKIINEATHGQEDTDEVETAGKSFLSRLCKRFVVIEKQGNVLATVFHRIEPFGGRKRGRPTPLYLEDVIRDAIAIFDTDISKLGVKLEPIRSKTLVRVDGAEIQEVIANLLQNSLYWLEQVDKKSRRIQVSVERPRPDEVQIMFADSGPGVRPEIRDQIFEPYFSDKPLGVGLGLSIAGEIVSDFYGGDLELVDAGPLDGAVFRITLRKRV